MKPTWDSFYLTDLDMILKEKDIGNLVVVGLQTEFCVETTCRKAYSMGYKTSLCRDGHTTFDTDIIEDLKMLSHHNNIMGGRFVKLLKTADIEFK